MVLFGLLFNRFLKTLAQRLEFGVAFFGFQLNRGDHTSAIGHSFR